MIKHGVVEETKEFPSKFPNGKSMWRFTVDGVRYSSGSLPPPKVGSYVEFDAEQKGEYWNASNIKASEPPKNVAVSKTNVSFSGNRDASIHYQSSRKDAIAFVDVLLKHGLIDFGKAKAAQKIEIVEIYIDNYTIRFNDDIARLSPPEHGSPVEASVLEEASVLMKPVRKTKLLDTEESFKDDEFIP